MRREQIYQINTFNGINKFVHPSLIPDNMFVQAKNLYLNTIGLYEKVKGSTKYNTTPITNAIRVQNGHTFYDANGNIKRIIIVHMTSNQPDKAYSGNDSTGTWTEITGSGTSLGSGKEYSFVTWLDKVIFADGYSAPKQWLGGTTYSILPNAPIGKYLIEYRDRLYLAYYNYDKSVVNFSGILDSTSWPAGNKFYVGKGDGDEITGLGIISIGTDVEGLRTQLAIFKNRSTWVLDGDITTGTLNQVSGNIGCPAYKTIVNTPIGLIFMSKENVYLIQPGGVPTPIGTPIRSEILKIPPSVLSQACAVYDMEDGYYKLSFATSNAVYNNISYWLDIRQYDSLKWVGPITGLNISCYIPSFVGQQKLVLAGDPTAGTVYKLGQSGYQHNGSNIEAEIVTKQYDFGSAYSDKIMNWLGVTVELAAGQSSQIAISVNVDDGEKIYSFPPIIPSTTSMAQWDVANWDVDGWAGTFLKTYIRHAGERLYGKRFQISLSHSANENVTIGGLMTGIKPIRRI